MTQAAGEVLSVKVQQELRDKWTWRCAGCGHILFKMEGSVIYQKCSCNTMNTLTLAPLTNTGI